MPRPSAALLTLALSAPAFAGDVPTVTQHPSDRSLCAGEGTMLVCRASSGGSTPLTFMWQIETAPGEWSQLPVFEPEEGVMPRVSVGFEAEASYLTFAVIGTGDNGNYRCLVSGPFGGTVSDPARLTALGADFGGPGGLPNPDFATDNNDFIAFIDAFFSGSMAADQGSAGGLRGGDGMLDNNDFVAFIGLFFDGCVRTW